MFGHPVFAKSIFILIGLTAANGVKAGSQAAVPNSQNPAAQAPTAASQADPMGLHCALKQYIPWVRAQGRPLDPDRKAKKLQEIDKACGTSLHLSNIITAYDSPIDTATPVLSSRGAALAAVTPDEKSIGKPSTSSASPPDVQIVKVDNFISGGTNDIIHAETVTAATVLPEGGFLALTSIRGGGSFAYKISRAGAVLWRRDLPLGTVANAAGLSADGSYWVAGNLSKTIDQKIVYGVMDFSERIGTDGAISLPVVLSATNKGHYFHCAAKSGENYIQTDLTSSRDEDLHLETQRISLTDGAGKLLWELYLSADQGRRIVADTSTFSNPNGQLFDCAGIFVGKNNRIFAATRVVVFPDFRTDEEVFEEVTQKRAKDLRSATLLVALDSNGTIVASVRHDNTGAGLAVVSPTGPLLFETMQARTGSYDLVATVGQRLSMHTFNSDLKEQKSPVIFGDSNFDRVGAAYQTQEGGVLMIGCSGDDNTRPVYLRYISAGGAYSPKRPSSELGLMCGGVIRCSEATQPGEILLLLQTPQQGNRLLTLKYSQ